MPNGLCTPFSRLADLLAWMQVVPRHLASVPRKFSVPSTDIIRLEPLERAARTYRWQLWLSEHRHRYLGMARTKLNTVGVKCSVSWLKQHCYHIPAFVRVCGIIIQSVGGFHTLSAAYSTTFYSR